MKAKKMNEIMLIDDDRATNYLSQYIIGELDCCENLSIHDMAQDALDDIQNRLDAHSPLPDVIFLDLNMPRINGWEFLEIYEQFDLHAYDKPPSIYVVSTTMNPNDRLRAESVDSVTKFYAKPLTAQIILETIADQEEN